MTLNCPQFQTFPASPRKLKVRAIHRRRTVASSDKFRLRFCPEDLLFLKLNISMEPGRADKDKHAEFELVPRLIGKRGCNMLPIQKIGAAARVRGRGQENNSLLSCKGESLKSIVACFRPNKA